MQLHLESVISRQYFSAKINFNEVKRPNQNRGRNTHTYTHICTAILVRTLINIMHFRTISTKCLTLIMT